MFLLSFFAGLAMLLGGAELLVRGGSQLALALRVPIVVVALTVVAFGTSMPEMTVSLSAATRGNSDLALGNITGSNIANIALVLGATAMVSPLSVGRELMRREVPTLVLIQVAIPLMLLDGMLGRIDGLILFAVGVVYNTLLIRDAMSGRAPVPVDVDVPDAPGQDRVAQVALVLVGVALLVGGAHFFVMGAVDIAELLGIPQRVIGVTVVALGTSAPEVVTGMVSAWRGENDMAVGNSLGSNILNVSLALALTAIIHPIEIADPGAWTDLAVAFLVTVLLIPIILRGRQVTRVEGVLLAASYVIYVVTLGVGGLE